MSSAVEILERQLLQVQGLDSQQESLLHSSAGNLYRDQGLFAEAAAHYAEAERLAMASGDSEQLVLALRDLGTVELQRGRLAAARSKLTKAMELLERAAPDVQLDVQRAFGNALREQGQLQAALQVYRRAQAARQQAGRPETLLELEADMAEAQMRGGDFKQAIGIMQAALARHDGSRGPPSPSEELALARVRSTLGAVYHWQGDADRAMRLYLKAVETQKSLRSDHEDLVGTQLSQARALRDLGRFAEAFRAIDRVEAALRAGAQQGPDLSRALLVKADLLRESERHSEAERMVTAALELQSRCFEDGESPEQAVAHNTYASILHDQHRLQEAQEQYLEALAINERTVGVEHLEVAAVHNNLGTLYTDLGDDESAEAHFRQCLNTQLRLMPADSMDLSTSFNNLAAVLFRRGSYEESAALLRKAVHVMDAAKVPANNPERVLYNEHLAQVKAILESDAKKKIPGLDTVVES